jgi:hypothetical protein
MRVVVGVFSALTILTGTASAAPKCDDAGVKRALMELAWNNPAAPSEVNAKFRKTVAQKPSQRSDLEKFAHKFEQAYVDLYDARQGIVTDIAMVTINSISANQKYECQAKFVYNKEQAVKWAFSVRSYQILRGEMQVVLGNDPEAKMNYLESVGPAIVLQIKTNFDCVFPSSIDFTVQPAADGRALVVLDPHLQEKAEACTKRSQN